MNLQASQKIQVSGDFNNASIKKNLISKCKGLKTRAFAIKFTDGERAYLEGLAGNLPLGTYCRRKLLGNREETRQPVRRPKIDDKTASLILAELGQSRLASNMNQLAKSANMGTLDVGSETEAELQDAAKAILAMRDALFTALGLKP